MIPWASALRSSARARRYGLYSSRSRGTWSRKPYLLRLAPEGWKEQHGSDAGAEAHPARLGARALRLVTDLAQVLPDLEDGIRDIVRVPPFAQERVLREPDRARAYLLIRRSLATAP